MSVATMLAEKVNHLITQTGHLHQTVAIVAEIPFHPFMRKLDGQEEFTVTELAGLARAFGVTPATLISQVAIKETRPCTLAVCAATSHQYENGSRVDSCRLEKVERDGFTVNGHYDLDGVWGAWVDADEIADGHTGIGQVQELLEAFKEMQARCDALNGRTIERHTEPGQPAVEELQGVGL